MTQEKENTKKLPRRGEFVATILGQKALGEVHSQMQLKLTGQAAEVFAQAKAGQFLQVACRDLSDSRNAMPLLRRPFSIAGIHKQDDSVIVEFIFRIMGPGTQWLFHRHDGEEVNLMGPLGSSFVMPAVGRPAILVGGGVGLPPMFFLADQLRRTGCEKILALAAARTESLLTATLVPCDHIVDCLEPRLRVDEFSRSQTPCIVATDDGSLGFRGLVVTALDEFLKKQPEWHNAVLYSCGPHPMLRALAKYAADRSMDCQVCLEAYMACGIGVCQSCAVAVHSGAAESKEKHYQLVCSHGPVFDAKKIAWD